MSNEPEFNTEQLDRIFELTQAAQEFRKIVAESDDIPYDVQDIWELIHICADQLKAKGRRVRIPTRVTAKNGMLYISEWHEEDEDADVECGGTVGDI